jgi:hypothetical protein
VEAAARGNGQFLSSGQLSVLLVVRVIVVALAETGFRASS